MKSDDFELALRSYKDKLRRHIAINSPSRADNFVWNGPEEEFTRLKDLKDAPFHYVFEAEDTQHSPENFTWDKLRKVAEEVRSWPNSKKHGVVEESQDGDL